MGNLCNQQGNDDHDKYLEANLEKEQHSPKRDTYTNLINPTKEAPLYEPVHEDPILKRDETLRNAEDQILENEISIKYNRTFANKDDCNKYELKRDATKRLFVSCGKRITVEDFEAQVPENIRMHEMRKVNIAYPTSVNLSDNLDKFDFPPLQINENVIYSGQWNEECHKHGEGIMFNKANNILYQGYFESDNLIYGRIVREDGSYYEGEIADFLPNGTGFKNIQDDVYKGKWLNGKLNGQITILYKDGTIYHGGFNENKEFEGEGKIIWADGANYTGSFKGNYIEGEGDYRNADGSFHYTGSFKASKFHGEGKSTWTHDGKVTKFVGEYENGQKKKGRFVLKNGEEFTCAYVDNKPHGEGEFKLPTGEVIKGKFDHGLFVNDPANSHSLEFMETPDQIDKEPSEYAPHVKYAFDTYKNLVANLKNKGGILKNVLDKEVNGFSQ